METPRCCSIQVSSKTPLPTYAHMNLAQSIKGGQELLLDYGTGYWAYHGNDSSDEEDVQNLLLSWPEGDEEMSNVG